MVKPVKKRPYSSTVRQEQAALTRARILEAASDLFLSNGYARTSIRAIAEAADVAPDTVYAVFGKKVRLLTALIDHRLSPVRGVANVMDRPEAQAARDESDPRRQLHLFARDTAAVSARVRPVFEILRTAAAVEPELAEVYAEMNGYRLQNMRRAVVMMAESGSLRVEVDRASEIVWALASPDVARLLCDQRGWSEEEYADWLEDTIARTLLA